MELPRGWVEAELEDLCEILDFKRIPVNSKERQRRIEGKSPQELYPYYGATGQVDVIDGYLFEGEHVLIGEDGAPFLDPIKPKAYMVDGKFWVNNHAHILRSLGNNRFLCHYLNYIRYEDHVTGTTRLKLTKSALVAIPVLVPPLSEQRRIVEKIEARFDEIDKGVESLQTAKTTLGLYRQSLLKSAFEGRLTADWRARNADKLEAPETLLARIQAERETRYKAALDDWEKALTTWRTGGEKGKKPAKPKQPNTFPDELQNLQIELPELPHGWVWAHLGLCSSGPEYGTAAKSSDTGEVPVIRMGNLQRGRIDWDNLAFTSDPDEIEQYSLRPGDVLFNRTNSPELVGKTSIYNGEGPALFAGYLVRVNQIEEIASGPYLTYFLNSPFASEHGKTVKTDGVNQSNINASKLQEYPFPYCSLAEQAEIVRILDARLDAADALEAEIDAALTRASALRQSILKKAFSGRLVPQDPADEPASALLERIRAERAKAPKTARKRKATA
jgi:type I restriction enzyme, S subunit